MEMSVYVVIMQLKLVNAVRCWRIDIVEYELFNFQPHYAVYY